MEEPEDGADQLIPDNDETYIKSSGKDLTNVGSEGFGNYKSDHLVHNSQVVLDSDRPNGDFSEGHVDVEKSSCGSSDASSDSSTSENSGISSPTVPKDFVQVFNVGCSEVKLGDSEDVDTMKETPCDSINTDEDSSTNLVNEVPADENCTKSNKTDILEEVDENKEESFEDVHENVNAEMVSRKGSEISNVGKDMEEEVGEKPSYLPQNNCESVLKTQLGIASANGSTNEITGMDKQDLLEKKLNETEVINENDKVREVPESVECDLSNENMRSLNEKETECLKKSSSFLPFNKSGENDGSITNMLVDLCESSRIDSQKSETRDNINENKMDVSIDKCPIKYKGFKKNNSAADVFRIDKHTHFKGNPFSPMSKKDSKSRLTSISPRSFEQNKDIDSSSLQPEYAQYLGLKPRLRFRCFNCGVSTFYSMSALNSHQVDCKKSVKTASSQSTSPQSLDSKSTNIKLTRKVFLCSACGTYYENWNLFLHMHEVHRRYICLTCLGMFSIGEKLSEHLAQKHKISNTEFLRLEEFLKIHHPNFFLLCVTCDQVFCETDNFYSHTCPEKAKGNDSNLNILSKVDLPVNTSKSIPSKLTSQENKSQKVNTNAKCVMGSKRMKIDWPSKTSSKTGIDDDYSCNIATLCKVDIGDSNSLPKGIGSVEESSGELKTPESEPGKQNSSEPSRTPEKEVISDPVPPPGETKNIELADEVQNMPVDLPKAGDDDNSKKPKSMKRSRPASAKKQVKKKKLSGVGKSTKKISKDNLTEVSVTNGLTETNSSLENSKTNIDDMEKKVDPFNQQNIDKKENSPAIEKNIFKFKMQPDMDSDGESDDSQKLSLVVDENASVSDTDLRKYPDEEVIRKNENLGYDTLETKSLSLQQNEIDKETPSDEIQLAGEEVAAMALTLDDKIDNVNIQAVVKECVRTSCLSCNYCRHAVKIAVNGKQLALHLLSEHRYTPVKNETCDDFVRRLKDGLQDLEPMFFNTETYDSSDPSIHIPYDKDSNFDCFQCNYVTTSHRDLYAHKRKSHTKSLLLCIMCKSNFYSYSELLCHLCPGTYNPEIQFHNTDINFRCCFCRLDTIPSAFRLMVHLRKCHHTCDICLEICTDQQKLSTHMWKHKLNHLCYRCGIAYASKPDITKHLFWKHGTESVLCKKCLQKKWPHVYHFCIPPTSFICEECNTSFSRAVALKVHKRIHAGDFSYPCTQCEKKFISKKLLSRHEERHKVIMEKGSDKNKAPKSSPDHEQKEELINVTDLSNEIKNSTGELLDSSKDELKDKSHKKHKKEKEKRSKQVVDVYDLPPLNLSSESDSSDEELKNKTNRVEDKSKNKDIKSEDENLATKISNSQNMSEERTGTGFRDDLKVSNNGTSQGHNELNNSTEEKSFISLDSNNRGKCGEPNLMEQCNQEDDTDHNETPLRGLEKHSDNADTNSGNIVTRIPDQAENTNNPTTNEPVEDIWENFYKTNSQTKNLPYPLCAMKYEVAYNIIMGDHDYCQQSRNEPIINEDVPSTSNIDLNPVDKKIEPLTPVKASSPIIPPEIPSLQPSTPKKKQKSPKKKTSKNNSSSSSDSSSDSDSSSCSCGPNCSCSSSSSNSSSSSSSDSDSSSTEGRQKQERRKKRKDKKSKPKEESTDTTKETVATEPISTEIFVEPEDPPIRESELETDETSTDEEFYDRQPQRIANQLLAEKRNQLMLLASVAPVNNGTSSPTQAQESSVLEPQQQSLNKQKPRSKKKEGKKKVQVREKKILNEKPPASTVPTFPDTVTPSKPKLEPKFPSSNSQLTVSDNTAGSGSETESTRASKRRRIPNKFYGYSSGEEEEKVVVPTPPTKLRKQDLPIPSPKRVHLPHAPPSTPRIQLTVPKQVIRKQYNPPKPKSDTSSYSDSESDSDGVKGGQTLSHQHTQPPDPPKTDVYCYCRCPYDEVSEMIACDDANCKIEWFHFECVGILVPPRGQWYCPECRKKRGLPT